jgi:hypothetical protein
MTIDARQLEEAIKDARRIATGWPGASLHPTLTILAEAASAYAATLPREVPVETWVLVDNAGVIIATGYDSDADARRHTTDAGHHPVRLTGTALLPPREKD